MKSVSVVLIAMFIGVNVLSFRTFDKSLEIEEKPHMQNKLVLLKSGWLREKLLLFIECEMCGRVLGGCLNRWINDTFNVSRDVHGLKWG